LGEDSSINLVAVVEVIKKFPGSKAPWVDEIHSEMLKTLDMVGLS